MLEPQKFDTPKTAAMRKFLKKEAPHRVTGLSIEPDGVFIYTDSSVWSDDAGAGTFREDTETAAIKTFYNIVQPAIRKNPVEKKSTPNQNNQLWIALAGFIVKLRSANREQISDALTGAKQGANDYSIGATDRAIYKAMLPILRKQLKGYAKNPAGRKKPARRKNPVSYYQIFKIKGNELYWLRGFTAEKSEPRFTLTRGDAARYESQKQAKFITGAFSVLRGWQVGIAKKGTSSAKIMETVSGK